MPHRCEAVETLNDPLWRDGMSPSWSCGWAWIRFSPWHHDMSSVWPEPQVGLLFVGRRENHLSPTGVAVVMSRSHQQWYGKEDDSVQLSVPPALNRPARDASDEIGLKAESRSIIGSICFKLWNSGRLVAERQPVPPQKALACLFLAFC